MKWGIGLAGLAAAGVIAVAVSGIGDSASAQIVPKEESRQSGSDRYRELLAEELGISVQALDDAQIAARNKLIDEAVAAGDISQDRAETLKEREFGEWFGRGPLEWKLEAQALGERLRGAVISVFEATANVVDVPVEELRDRLANGESLVDIAAGQGVDEDELKTGLVDEITKLINQAVQDGDISQDKADLLLEHLDDIVERAVDFEIRLGNLRFDHEGFERFFRHHRHN